jgi:hypothetical protein
MKELSRALIVCLLAASAQSQTLVSFCDLVRNPEQYNGKTVRVRATYEYGFEWQRLYCRDCRDRGDAWLELPADLDDASQKALKHAHGRMASGKANLTAEGVFVSGGGFGHLSRYQYKFIAHKVGDVVAVSRGMKCGGSQSQVVSHGIE